MIIGALPNQVKIRAFVGVYSPMSDVEARFTLWKVPVQRSTHAVCHAAR